MMFNTGRTASSTLPLTHPCRRVKFLWLRTAVTLAALTSVPQLAFAQITGTVDSSNIGVATEDAVISSGLPNANLDFRTFNDGSIAQQLMNTSGAAPDYPSSAVAAGSQEYMIFKFDLSTLPAGAQATAPGSFDFSTWFTLAEGTDGEAIFGEVRFYEITSGNAGWQDRWIADGVENATPVTFGNLNGVFTELSGLTEDNTDPANNTFGPFGVLYPGKLVANGGFDGANRIVGIPVETLNRLISGQSIGLALGSVAPAATNPSADFDGNGTVENRDMAINWQAGFGTVTEATKAQGDANGDGDVDGDDFLAWQTQLGSVSGSASEGRTNFSIHTTESFFSPASAPTLNFDWSAPAVTAIPESSSATMALLAATAFWFRRRAETA